MHKILYFLLAFDLPSGVPRNLLPELHISTFELFDVAGISRRLAGQSAAS